MRRDKPKDAYDIVWLIDALGPERAAEMISASPLLTSEMAPEVLSQLRRLVTDQFPDTAAAGPAMYAGSSARTTGKVSGDTPMAHSGHSAWSFAAGKSRSITERQLSPPRGVGFCPGRFRGSGL
jgi:hypothetical protein